MKNVFASGVAVTAVFLLMLSVDTHAQTTPQKRLLREVFDVIPPSDRIKGERGSMSVWQQACRIGPTKWARRRMVDVAAQEWAYFGFQTVDHTVVEKRFLPAGIVSDAVNPLLPGPRVSRNYPRLGLFDGEKPVTSTIAGYWSATGEGQGVLDEQNTIWNAVGNRDASWRRPWSAAFVSWVACEAGLGDMAQFARAASHRVYIDQAIAARDGVAATAAYTAYDPGEARLQPGDILCNGRAGATYRSLADRRQDAGQFAPTHCDIVVKVDKKALRIFTIGGNVLSSVSLTILRAVKDAGGNLRPIDDTIINGAKTVFAHLKLAADPVENDALDHSPAIRALSSISAR